MAVRQDKVQISIAFLTDESKEYAKLINSNKQFIKELKDTIKTGGDVATSLDKMVDAAKGAEKIDLSKVAPAQLRAEAKQLEQTISLIPKSAPQYTVLKNRLEAVKNELRGGELEGGKMGAALRALGISGGPAFDTMTKGAAGFNRALGIIGLVIGAIAGAIAGLKGLFNIGVDAEALGGKMTAVFGESAKVVDEFADKNAIAIGLSRREYKGLATDVGDLLTPMGFTKKTAAELSVELVNQAGVLSRWTKGKVDTKTATEILNKALLGERDALNQLGLDIKDATIKNELKRKGLQDLTGDELKQAEALITLEQITKQSSNANAAYAKGTEDLQEKKARLRARISELVDRMGAALIPVFNKVLEVIIPVVEGILNFGDVLGFVWKKTETFRTIVSNVFSAIGVVIANTARGISDIAEGFGNLFSGEFTKAFDSFKGAFNALNPFETGAEIKKGFVEGFGSAADPKAEIKTDAPAAEGEGRKLASAFGNGYDAQFQIIKANSKKSAEDIAKEQKKALDVDLKEVEANALREEALLELKRARGALSERQYENRLVAIKREKLEESLAVYEKYAQDQTTAALKLQTDLAKLTADTTRAAVPPLAALPGRQAGPVTSNNDGTAQRLNVTGSAAAINDRDLALKALAAKGKEMIVAEQNFELARLQLKRDTIAQEIDILKSATQPQVEEISKREQEKLKVEEEIGKKRLDNDKRLEELRQQTLQTGLQTTADVFSAAADLLAQDEASKKKHAGTIKALQKANIELNLVAEVSGIFANAQKSPVAQLLGPVAGNILAGVQAGLAVARAVIAIKKVEAQKFARGRLLQLARSAKLGFFGGNYHSQGGTQIYGSDGSHFEVERDEAFAIVNRKNAPILRMLSQVNALNGNGDPFYERGGLRFAAGGLPTVNTTPSFDLSSSSAAAPGSSAEGFAALEARFDAFQAEMSQWQRELKVVLVYGDVEAAGKKVDTITKAANF